MSKAAFRVRRATVDDLDALRNLWQAMGYPTEGLERQVTEFQVAVDGDGVVCGALGLEISGRHGRLHSEAFADFARADEFRAEFWGRLQLVASNHGVARFWTEESSLFWRQQGFDQPDDATAKKLPPVWAREQAKWLTLQVWDEEVVEKTLAREVAQFKATEQQINARRLRRGRILNYIATALAILLAIFVGAYALWLLRAHFDNLPH